MNRHRERHKDFLCASLERLGGKKGSDLHHRNLYYEELFSAELSHESLRNTKAGAFFFPTPKVFSPQGS